MPVATLPHNSKIVRFSLGLIAFLALQLIQKAARLGGIAKSRLSFPRSWSQFM